MLEEVRKHVFIDLKRVKQKKASLFNLISNITMKDNNKLVMSHDPLWLMCNIGDMFLVYEVSIN